MHYDKEIVPLVKHSHFHLSMHFPVTVCRKTNYIILLLKMKVSKVTKEKYTEIVFTQCMF